MKKITAIVGLPGSGKTEYAKSLNDQAILIDDPKLFENDVEPFLNGDKDIVITDPWFCLTVVRAAAEIHFKNYGFEVTWVFFENDVKACTENYKRRHPTKNVSHDIKWFSSKYSIPENTVTVPVWKP